MISSILIPTDFSPASWKATQFGIELYRMNKELKLSVLHVYPVSSNTMSMRSNGYLSLLEEVKIKMNKLSEELVEKPNIIDNVVLPGNVEHTLIDFIHQNSFDLVIVGINGNGYNNDIGSHTVNVIENSGVPVMIVPNNPSTHGALTS